MINNEEYGMNMLATALDFMNLSDKPMPALVNHNEFVNNACQMLIDKQTSDTEKRRLDSEVDHFFREEVNLKTKWSGDTRMQKIIHLVNNIPGYELSYFQKMCMDQVWKCMAPIIFGNPPAHELAMNLKIYGLEPPDTSLLFFGTSRRGGKTDSLTISAGAMLACCPNITILYFSLYIPTCKVACATVYSWLRDWGFCVNGQVKRNSMSITFTNPDDPSDVRVIRFISGQNEDVRPMFT